MDLLPTGSKGDLIFIETELFKLHIKGKRENKKSDAINANMNVPGHIRVDYDDFGKIIVKTLTSNGELVNNESYEMMPCFYEEGLYEILLINKSNDLLGIYHDSYEINNSFNTVENVTFGSFSFEGEIGYSTFRLVSGSNIILSLTLEVFPAKMDYRSDYINMINEVNDEIASLAFEFMGKTYQDAVLTDTTHQTASVFYNILTRIYDKLNDAIKRIEKSPKHNLLNIERVQYINKAKHISKSNTSYLRKHAEKLYINDKGININGVIYMPQQVIEMKKEATVDIFENRFVKYIIKSVIKRINVIRLRIVKVYGEDNSYYKILGKFDKELNSYLHDFFSNIGELNGRKSMSLVFQMAPGYREVYYYYMLLKKGLSLSDDLYTITPKKMWKLYEIWCYIKLHNILKKFGYEVVNYGIIKAIDQGLYLKLVQSDQALMEYRNREGHVLELWYNRSYTDLPTSDQRPDNVLCIRKKGKAERMYIFDAKYRFSVDSKGIIGPMEDDINIMHRYRDAIVSELGNGLQFKYNTFGAYVMFPYGDEEKFENHQFYKSLDTVNIGAFPMLPRSTTLIENHLKKLLNETNIEAGEKLIVHSKYDDYGKFRHKNVMVANIKDERHLKAYIGNKFFHIPANILKNIRPDIEYIAFYASKRSFPINDLKAQKGIGPGINYYGKIKSYKQYLRNECVELPKENDEPYIRFDFEYIKEIGPIEPYQYGTETVTYTTMYLLENAEYIQELYLKNNSEIELYKVFKEIMKNTGRRVRRLKDYYRLDDTEVRLVDDKNIRINGSVYKCKEGLRYLRKLYL